MPLRSPNFLSKLFLDNIDSRVLFPALGNPTVNIGVGRSLSLSSGLEISSSSFVNKLSFSRPSIKILKIDLNFYLVIKFAFLNII